uniref:C2H2-type domain-containing protein n=1 Tax=Rhodnius prolixus TaxID=13249 RepID=A0ABL0EJV6_RHOPR
MAKPNPVWSQFGAANSVCKTGSMCNNHYPAQSSQVHQTSNLSSVYGMFYDQNLRQEPSRTSSGHIGNGSHYLASQQVGLAGSMPLSQQSYVGLPFSAYSLPLPHNFIHRPVAHVDPQNYQYFAGSHSYGSSTSRRVTPYQRGVRPDRRRAQESVRRGFELIRPEMENSRRNVPLRNMLEPVASLSTTGMPQSSVAEASSFMGASAQEGGWAGEERRIERISNPDMIPLMYPIPQMQPSHLTQTESVAQISQAHLNHSAGLPPTPWQCLDLQGQQCYGGPPASTDYRAEEARPSLQPQRHYNINSSIETGEIFDDINGTRESRHRSSSSSLQSHALSNRSNNVFPSDERLWESALHPPQNLNYPTMSSEGVGSHGLLNVGYYDSLVADAGSLVGSSLRAEPTPPPAHPDTTTRDPQESAEQVSTSQHLNLALTQPATTPQLCFPQNNNDCQNEGNNPLNVCHGNEDTVNKIDEEFVKNDIIESTLQDTIIKEDLQLDNNENTKIKNNNNIIIENNNTVDKVGIVSSPTDLRADITGTDSTHHRSEAIAKLAVNQDNRAQALPYSEHAQSYQSIASPQMMLPCDGCCQEEELDASVYDVCSEYHSPAESTPLELPNLLQTLKSPASVNSQDISSEVGEDGSFEEKLQEKVSLKASEYPMKEDVHDDFNLIEQSESENVVEVDVKEEREDEAYKRLERNAVQFWSQDTLPSLPSKDCNRDDSNDEKVDVEIHHCLLCGQSYLSKEEMFRHDRSAGHRRLELVQRRAHHRAYQRATGSYDPTVPTLTPKDHEFLVHLPHVPGFRNYYHHSSHFTDLD